MLLAGHWISSLTYWLAQWVTFVNLHKSSKNKRFITLPHFAWKWQTIPYLFCDFRGSRFQWRHSTGLVSFQRSRSNGKSMLESPDDSSINSPLRLIIHTRANQSIFSTFNLVLLMYLGSTSTKPCIIENCLLFFFFIVSLLPPQPAPGH